MINVNKNQRIQKIKVHDEEIIDIKLSLNKNLIYSLDKKGMLKITDFLKGETQQVINLNEKNSKNKNFAYFDVDHNDKNIVFNKNQKIKNYNLENKKVEKFGSHSSEINFLKFSSDGKFIISMTNKDYFINIWYKKNINEPLITLQRNTHTTFAEMKFIDKGIYHFFTYNKATLFGYKLILDEIDPTVPVKSSFEIEFLEKNLINMEIPSNQDIKKPMNIFILYGKAFNAANLSTKVVSYSKNARAFKESLKISQKDQEKLVLTTGVNTTGVKIINEIEMGNSAIITDEFNLKVTKEIVPNVEEVALENEKISLLNIIRNSIVNNDNSTLQWALDQKDTSLIETTVKKMDSLTIQGFVDRIIEVFQSNSVFKRNILPWFQSLFKYHQIEILKMPAKTLVSLSNVQALIKNRTKNYSRLMEIGNKLEFLINNSKTQNQKKYTNEFTTYEPLLVYHESDSEEETKNKIKEKLRTEGIEKTKISEFRLKAQEDNMAEDDVDMFDNDAEMEDLLDEEMAIEEEKESVQKNEEEDDDFSEDD